jgi:hypothetical protein
MDVQYVQYVVDSKSFERPDEQGNPWFRFGFETIVRDLLGCSDVLLGCNNQNFQSYAVLRSL